ncbi:MAG: HEAT repeat domain-containing protein [Planctomycetes bacterium]|nr:HEAT repeat domain-containing protein [Planctomycetota bacterium]
MRTPSNNSIQILRERKNREYALSWFTYVLLATLEGSEEFSFAFLRVSNLERRYSASERLKSLRREIETAIAKVIDSSTADIAARCLEFTSGLEGSAMLTRIQMSRSGDLHELQKQIAKIKSAKVNANFSMIFTRFWSVPVVLTIAYFYSAIGMWDIVSELSLYFILAAFTFRSREIDVRRDFIDVGSSMEMNYKGPPFSLIEIIFFIPAKIRRLLNQLEALYIENPEFLRSSRMLSNLALVPKYVLTLVFGANDKKEAFHQRVFVKLYLLGFLIEIPFFFANTYIKYGVAFSEDVFTTSLAVQFLLGQIVELLIFPIFVFSCIVWRPSLESRPNADDYIDDRPARVPLGFARVATLFSLAGAVYLGIVYRLPSLNEVGDFQLIVSAIDPSMKAQFLIQNLSSDDEEVRFEAAEMLGYMGADAKEAVPALVELMHEDSRVGVAIRIALTRMGELSALMMIEKLGDDEKSIQALWVLDHMLISDRLLGRIEKKFIEMLESPKKSTRLLAATSIAGRFGENEEVLSALCRVVESESDDEIRAKAIDAIGLIGACSVRATKTVMEIYAQGKEDKSWLAAENTLRSILIYDPTELIRMLLDDRNEVRLKTIFLLQNAPGKIADRLIDFAGGGETVLAVRCVELLGTFQRDQVKIYRAVLKVVESENPELKAAAIRSICELRMRFDDTAKLVLPFLNHEDATVRLAVVQGIERLGATSSFIAESLAEIRDDESTMIRFALARTLGRLHFTDPVAIRTLVYLAHDEDVGVNEMARNEIRFAGGSSLSGEELAELTRDDLPEIRSFAVSSLVAIGNRAEPAVPALEEMILSGECEPFLAITAISNVGVKALPSLLKLLRDGPDEARIIVAERLPSISIDPDLVLPALLLALYDENSVVRHNAARSIGALGPIASGAEMDLASLFGDEDDDVRIAAIWAVARIDPDVEFVAEGLAPLLKSENHGVRMQAARTLAILNAPMSESTELFIALAMDEESMRRDEAITNLIRQGPDAVPRIVAEISAARSFRIFHLIYALGEIGPAASEATGVVIASLDSLLPQVPITSATTLGKIAPDDERVVRALISKLSTQEIGITTVSIDALRRSNVLCVERARAYAKILKHRDPLLRDYAMKSLGLLGPDAGAVTLEIIEAFEDNTTALRHTIIVELRHVGPSAAGAIPTLENFIRTHTSDQYRMMRIEA